jgi:hypothetical protein
MKRNKTTHNFRNCIKIFPGIEKNLSESQNSMKKDQNNREKLKKLEENVIVFPKFSSFTTDSFKNRKENQGLMQVRSIFDDCSTLLNPRLKGKKHLLCELNKIIEKCDDGFLRSNSIKLGISKTQDEIITLRQQMGALHTRHENRKAFRMIYKGKEPTFSRANMKQLIQDMKIVYKRTMAM